MFGEWKLVDFAYTNLQFDDALVLAQQGKGPFDDIM